MPACPPAPAETEPISPTWDIGFLLRSGLRRIAPHAYASGIVPIGLGPPHPDLVMAFWIDAQCAYFSGAAAQGRVRPGKAEQNRRIHRRCALLTNIAYAVGLAPAIAAAISIFSERRAFRDHAHQYDRMGRLFGAGALLIRRDAHGVHDVHDAPQVFAAIVRDLGAEALAENGDWLMAHRERQDEPVKGG